MPEVVLGKVKGEDGVTPNIRAGTTTTLPYTEQATVTRREGSPDSDPVFDFGIPQGESYPQVVAVENGGTGATTAEQAKENLGVSEIAVGDIIESDGTPLRKGFVPCSGVVLEREDYPNILGEDVYYPLVGLTGSFNANTSYFSYENMVQMPFGVCLLRSNLIYILETVEDISTSGQEKRTVSIPAENNPYGSTYQLSKVYNNNEPVLVFVSASNTAGHSQIAFTSVTFNSDGTSETFKTNTVSVPASVSSAYTSYLQNCNTNDNRSLLYLHSSDLAAVSIKVSLSDSNEPIIQTDSFTPETISPNLLVGNVFWYESSVYIVPKLDTDRYITIKTGVNFSKVDTPVKVRFIISVNASNVVTCLFDHPIFKHICFGNIDLVSGEYEILNQSRSQIVTNQSNSGNLFKSAGWFDNRQLFIIKTSVSGSHFLFFFELNSPGKIKIINIGDMIHDELSLTVSTVYSISNDKKTYVFLSANTLASTSVPRLVIQMDTSKLKIPANHSSMIKINEEAL